MNPAAPQDSELGRASKTDDIFTLNEAHNSPEGY